MAYGKGAIQLLVRRASEIDLTRHVRTQILQCGFHIKAANLFQTFVNAAKLSLQ